MRILILVATCLAPILLACRPTSNDPLEGSMETSQIGNLMFDDLPKMAQDGGPRTFHSHELAPVMIPREAIIPLDTFMHAAPIEPGPAAGPHSSNKVCDDCTVDAAGVGNLLQLTSPRAPSGACMKKYC